ENDEVVRSERRRDSGRKRELCIGDRIAVLRGRRPKELDRAVGSKVKDSEISALDAWHGKLDLRAFGLHAIVWRKRDRQSAVERKLLQFRKRTVGGDRRLQAIRVEIFRNDVANVVGE